jgi:hypothetical protein
LVAAGDIGRRRRAKPRLVLPAGITKAGTGVDGISWNILGQTYVPKQVSESSFPWHATFPPGTIVPPLSIRPRMNLGLLGVPMCAK